MDERCERAWKAINYRSLEECQKEMRAKTGFKKVPVPVLAQK